MITSKQRPRKICLLGDDGKEYVFLLKGHEDLRLDERVMQLFGLVNTLLANARTAADKDLSIERYAVVPLSPNIGLIGWLPHCDTLHQLIRDYRHVNPIWAPCLYPGVHLWCALLYLWCTLCTSGVPRCTLVYPAPAHPSLQVRCLH